MIFGALGGLANRLRAIFSRYEPGKTMRVNWTRTWDIADAHFLDVFEPVPGVEFVDAAPDDQSWHAAINYDNWHRHYALLRPTAALRERVSGLQEAMGPYVAIHVRRTDHVKLAHTQGRYTTDEEFIAWANPSGYPGDDPWSRQRRRELPLFLATDNEETRHVFDGAFRARLHWAGPMQPSTALQHESRRYNSLADAVVDLFVCVGAQDFMGSAHSSFSELIMHLRELR